MRYRRTAAVVATAMSTMAVATLLVSPQAQARSTLDWHGCADAIEPDKVECATLTVPIDWARGGDTIGISLIRRPATDKAKRIGTLVYLPGGPGDSGVDQLLRGPKVTKDAAARFDVVSLDPRGVKRSSAIRCDKDLVRAPVNVDPDMGARFTDVMEHSRKLGESCRLHTGSLIDHMDSVHVARDVEALRAALGERRINLYSRSYGTLAAQAYAEKFPHRVRGIVLDSVFDHSLPGQEFMATMSRAAESSFNAFADWCSSSTECALHGQDVGAVFDDLYRRAGLGELGITPFQLTFMTQRAFYEPSWVKLSGDLAAMAGQGRKAAAATAEPEPFASAIFCADNRFVVRSEQDWLRQWNRQKRLAPHMRTHFGWLPTSLCAGWPFPATNPQRKPQIDPSLPVLLLNARHDPATGIEFAVNVNKAIRGSVLVTYEGAGHGVYNRNECTEQVTDRYLIDGVMPARGTSCAR